MIIIHGDNQTASRSHLENLRRKYEEIINLNGKNLKLEDLIQACESNSIFSTSKLIVVENISSNKNKEIFKYLQNSNSENLVVWENKELGKRDLNEFGSNVQIVLYKLPIQIFKFIDLIISKNKKQALALYQQISADYPAEMIIYFLIKQYRYLILLKSGSKEGPSDFKKMQSWQIAKLTQSANLYTLDELIRIYKKLLEISYKDKNGLTEIKSFDQLIFLILFNN